MTRQRLDWRLVIVLLLAGAIFFAMTLIVHRWQRSAQSSHEAAVLVPIAR